MIRATLRAAVLVLAAAVIAPQLASADSSGRFTVQEYETSGSWKIVEQGEKRFLILSKDFRTAAGPDLKIFFSPTGTKMVSGKNATRGSFKLAKLESHRGAQRYELPGSLDLGRYKTLAIHCERYSKLFAASSLE